MNAGCVDTRTPTQEMKRDPMPAQPYVDYVGVAEAEALLAANARPLKVRSFKDSGTRQSFSTGAIRDAQAGKGRFDLIPFWPVFAYASVLQLGAAKYAAKNWQKGMPVSRYIDSAQRHLYKYTSGMRDEPHLWMALWNIAGAIHTQVNIYLGLYPKEFNDMTDDLGAPVECISKLEKELVDGVGGVKIEEHEE